MSTWIVFYVKDGKELIAYTKRGTFEGEAKATAELLAYENNLSIDEIMIVEEERKTEKCSEGV